MKNKILLISFIFILISFAFINSSFAYTVNTNKTNYRLNISDEAYSKLQTFDEYKSGEYYYFVRYWDNNTYEYYFFHANDLGDVYFISRDGTKFKSSGSISSVKIYIVNSSYEITSQWTSSNYTFNMDFYTNVNDKPCWNYLSNFTIYWDDACTQVFFYQPPIVLPEVPAETIVEIPAVTTVEQIPEAMVATLKLIIPIGLVVLSAVLLIYLTRRLICRFS